ncbi:MAG TPA: hypothetical protein DCY79_04300 [Planctomycetaceae bacterium]|nr:hypothetical protein [Planctomycetaceae bacterium]
MSRFDVDDCFWAIRRPSWPPPKSLTGTGYPPPGAQTLLSKGTGVICERLLYCLPLGYLHSAARVAMLAITLAIANGQQACVAQQKPAVTARFQVFWQDGSTTSAEEIDGWSQVARPQDESLDAASINRKPLFNLQNPARLVRNITLSNELKGPFIQLTNGDTLPGRIVTVSPATAPTNEDSLHVSIIDPLSTLDARSNLIQVRRDAIARIATGDRQPDSFTPGLVVFRGGGRTQARAIRWTPSGIRLLSERAVKSAAWSDLVDVHMPQVDRMQAVLRDTAVELPQASDFLGRMVTTNGAVFTYHRGRIRTGVHRGKLCHIVQPSWAVNAIYVPVDSIVSTSYRRIDEIALPQLPATELARRSVFGQSWQWRRNRNVQGQPLSSGERQADFGIGMWSHSEIAFELPPHSVAFSAWVGIDRRARDGGCVRCKLYRDDVANDPIWTSELLRSGQAPVRAEVNNLNGARRLVLVAEFAHENRQPGDLPFDMCDMVSWLSPVVRIDREPLQGVPLDLEQPFPELAGWSISEETRQRISIRSFHDGKRGKWTPVMVLDKDRDPQATVAPLVLFQEVDVTLANAWLVGATGRDDMGKFGYRVIVKADGKHIRGTEGYDSNTTGYAPGDWDTVAYSLGEYVGKKVQLTVTVHPVGDEHAQLCGLLWGELSLSPFIQNLPDDGKPLQPDLVLTTLASLSVESEREDALKSLLAEPSAKLRWFAMDDSVAMPADVQAISCDLDPRSKRFVACIGPSGFSSEVGPFEVWVDDKLVWQSGRITRLIKAQQIDIRLPAKPGKRLTLRVKNQGNHPATWGKAGFVFQ